MDRSMRRWLRLMRVGEILGCHQMPERSFFYKGFQFPVCARCTGVLLGFAAAAPLFFFCKLDIRIALLLSFVMFLDWLLQFLKIRPSTNLRRLFTGMIGGFGWTYIHLYFYRFVWRLLWQLWTA